MGESERDDDYEYGYDYLYEEEKPADAEDDADGPDEEASEEDEIEERLEYDDPCVDPDESDDDTDHNEMQEEYLTRECITQEFHAKPLDLSPPEDIHFKLKRDAKAEALRRYEEAARSPAEFMAVLATWDKLDQNRERRERYNEVLREEGTLEYGANGQGLIFPRWMMDPTYRQLSRGNNLDYLMDCPYEMHGLTGKAYLRKIVEGMKEEHREILFFLYLRLYSPQRLAAVRGQTDRNIRKVRDTVLRKVRKKVYNELKKLNEQGYSMTNTEREFFLHYEEQEGKAK